MGLFSSIKDTVGSVGNALGVGQVAGGITDRLGGDFSNIPIAVIDNAISGITGAGSKFDDWLRNEEGQQAAEEAAAAAEQAQLDANALQQQWQEYLMGVQQPYIEAGAEFLREQPETLCLPCQLHQQEIPILQCREPKMQLPAPNQHLLKLTFQQKTA